MSMENMPLVSIIVPIYNMEKYLNKCIDSIVRQTYDNLDIILVNDGSTDSCQEICKTYEKIDKRIRVILKENSGPSASRNLGLKNARGEYIYFIDSDDYISDNAIQLMVEYALQYKCKMVISDAVYEVGGQDKEYNNLALNGQDQLLTSEKVIGIFLEHKGMLGSPWVAWGKLYDANLFHDIEYPIGRLSEDILPTVKLINKAETILYIYKKSYHYIIRGDSITGVKSEKLILDNYYYMNKLYQYISDYYPTLIDKMKVEYAWCLLLIALQPSCTYKNVLKEILVELKKFSKAFFKSDRPWKHKILMFLFVHFIKLTKL